MPPCNYFEVFLLYLGSWVPIWSRRYCAVVGLFTIGIIITFAQLNASPAKTPTSDAHHVQGWGDLAAAFADEKRKHSLLGVTANATRLSYVATHGTYFNGTEALTGVPGDGWERVPQLLRDPINGGFHAVVFVHPATNRGLVAFRGTDLNTSGISGQADFCADRVLWDNASTSDLPPVCHQFAAGTLDYLTGALELVQKTQELLAGSDLLLTGHSLGAGLAILAAAAHSQPKSPMKALVFSSPGFDDLLQRRLHISPGQLAAPQLRAIYNEFDPVYRKATSKHGIHGATSCVFQGLPEPASCSNCYRASPRQPSVHGDCLRCFEETHVFKNYLKLVSNSWPLKCNLGRDKLILVPREERKNLEGRPQAGQTASSVLAYHGEAKIRV